MSNTRDRPAHVDKVGGAIITYSSHRGVISGFGQHVIKSAECPADRHRWLREAVDKRQLGDDEIFPTLDEDDVRDLQHKAERFLHHTIICLH